MRLLTETDTGILRPSVATIGFFDGVHRGHGYLIGQVRRAAEARGLSAAVITFPRPPRQVMYPDFHPQLLTTCDEKLALLASTGIDSCIMLPFTPELARLSALQFMALLKEHYRVEALVIGHDHRFGHNRSEGFADYCRYGEQLGMEVLQAGAFPCAGLLGPAESGTPAATISSSLIRRLLAEGDVSSASRLFGYDYFLEGLVVHGHRVGHRIGYPTANLRPSDPDKLVPADGVYAVRARLGDSREYGGMLSIGHRPTLDNGTDRSIEVHIFDFQGDAYDAPLRLSFVERTRSEQKFDSLEALTVRLHQDEQEVRAILEGQGGGVDGHSLN